MRCIYYCLINLAVADNLFSHQVSALKVPSNDLLAYGSRNAWVYSGKFEGDIAGVNPNFIRMITVNRNAIKNRNLRWRDAIIPYVLDPRYTEIKVVCGYPRNAANEAAIIMKAFHSYHTKTCVRFTVRTTETDYLYIYKDAGCHSMVGKAGGKQDISLGPGCLYQEIIVHELMHTLGFWHEHSREDRDKFIRIRWENVAPGMESQFSTVGHAFAHSMGESYDYLSVLHYDSKAFSKNAQNTVEAISQGMTELLGRGLDLSEGDVNKINRLYDCKNALSQIMEMAYGMPYSGISTKPTLKCIDKFVDCHMFKRFCYQENFAYEMKLYCSETCGFCLKIEVG